MEKWIDNNGIFKCFDLQNTQYDKLPKGVYNIGLNLGGWFLEKMYDQFEFNYKIYNFHQDYLEYIINSYNSTEGNLGVLFNGLKGSGKTVLAKLLCNQLNMPVIIMKSFGERNDSLIEYLSSINTDIILFFDEFEKTFDENDSTILKLMDGVYNNSNRKLFILTTNKLYINNNLLNRPSRLRYLLEFNSLEPQVIEAYIKDNLKDITYYDKVLEMSQSLSNASIDVLKQVVNEINLVGFENFEKYKDIFNIEFNKYCYNCIASDWFDSLDIKEELPKILKEIEQYKNDNFKNDSESSYYFYTDSYSWPKSFYTIAVKDTLSGDNQVIYINYEAGIILLKSKERNNYKIINVLNPYVTNHNNLNLVL